MRNVFIATGQHADDSKSWRMVVEAVSYDVPHGTIWEATCRELGVGKPQSNARAAVWHLLFSHGYTEIAIAERGQPSKNA